MEKKNGKFPLFGKKQRRKDRDDSASILCARSKGEKVLYGVVFVLFLVYAASLIYPLLWMIINSFQDPLDYFNKLATGGNPFELPKKWLFENYKTALTGMYAINSIGEKIFLPEMLFNSIWFCTIRIVIPVFMFTTTGYVLSKYKFKGHGLIYGFVIFTMTIPIVGTGGAIFKFMVDVGLYNNPLYVIVTSLGGFGFNFLLMHGFFQNVSWNYAEAVFIDGGGHFTVYFKIMLPQARPLMITLGILSFIGTWNDYMTALMYLPDYPTLASGLYMIQKSFTRSGNIPAYFAGLIIATIPVITVFTCFSDTIMKNYSVGGLKG